MCLQPGGGPRRGLPLGRIKKGGIPKNPALLINGGELLVLLSSKELLEDLELVAEHLDGCRVGALFALHGSNNHLVAGGQLFEVGVLGGVGLGQLQALGEKIVGYGLLNGLGMRLLVHDPAGELMGVGGRVLGKLNDLSGGLFDRFEIGLDQAGENIVIGIDSARNLTVGGNCCRREEGKGAKCKN